MQDEIISLGLLLPDTDRPAKMSRSIAGLISVLLVLLGTSGSQPGAAPGGGGGGGGGGGDLDWASGCRDRNGCECKWVHGKRTATCPPHLSLDRLPEFPAPDRIQVSVRYIQGYIPQI